MCLARRLYFDLLVLEGYCGPYSKLRLLERMRMYLTAMIKATVTIIVQRCVIN